MIVSVFSFSDALREQGLPVKFQKFLLDKPPHNVADVNRLLGVSMRPLEPVRVYEGEEQVKIFFLPVVRCSRKQQIVPCDIGQQSAELETLGV